MKNSVIAMKDIIKVFPFYITRICGGLIEEFNKLNLSDYTYYLNKTTEINENLIKIKENISVNLYKLIPKIKDYFFRNKLINIRRDVYNEREILSDEIVQITPYINKEIEKLLNEYVQNKNDSKYFEEQKNIFYLSKISGLRKRLIKLAKNPVFQKGILLSSSHFYKDLKGYINNKKTVDQRKIELTLIKYLSRMYFKTSPFSTFTNIALNKYCSNTDSLKLKSKYNTKNKPLKVKSYIYLNNYIFRYLKNLLEANSMIVKYIPLQLNKTITKNNSQYVFIANDRNREAVQKITATPALDYFNFLFTSNKQLTINNVKKIFKSNNPEKISNESIVSYIKQLLNYNFLEYNWEISELDPMWSDKLQNKLIQFSSILEIKELIDILYYINSSLQQYKSANAIRREAILEDIFLKIRNISRKLHHAGSLPEDELSSFSPKHKENTISHLSDKKASLNNIFTKKNETTFTFQPQNLIFEDTSVKLDNEIESKTVNDIISKLHLISKYSSMSNHLLNDHENMLYFFKKKYGLDSQIDVLKFYEDYSNKTTLTESKTKSGHYNSLSKSRNTLIEKKFQKIISVIKEEKQDFTNIISLHEKHLLLLKPDLSYSSIRKYKISLCAFLQLYKNKKNKQTAVLNGSSIGFGKMYSRFLYMFNPEITSLLRKWNTPEYPDVIFAENIDSSDLNVNMHPPLMKYKFETFPNDKNLNSSSQIAIKDLSVIFDKSMKKLQLIHKKSGKYLYFFDLGFQGPMGRSGLFKFINSFYTVHCIHPFPLISKINSYINKNNNIDIIPRIIYEDQIILQRKTWIVNKKILPYQQKTESNSDYFFRINRWRTENSIPKEIFIHINNNGDLTQDLTHKTDETIKKIGKDDYKPQYINFANPFLVDLFGKIINKVPNNLSFVEMLPNSNQLISINKQNRVTEFMVQWYY